MEALGGALIFDDQLAKGAHLHITIPLA